MRIARGSGTTTKHVRELLKQYEMSRKAVKGIMGNRKMRRQLMKQLQGRAISQVKGASVGMAHNLSGLCAEHTVVVYGREPV